MQVKGVDPAALHAMIQKHAKAGKDDSNSSGEISLLEFVDMSQVDCLNESHEHGIKSILSGRHRNTSENFLQSDADEQLLINITFNQTVRVRSILIYSANPGSGPKDVKLMINKPTLGFDDCEDAQEPDVAQVVQFSEDSLREGSRVNLRFVRFQNVKVLSIFVGSNHGGSDETQINAIDVFGVPVQSTKDLAGLKKTEE